MNYVSVCSGIGGIDAGLDRAGMTCVAQVEIDRACQGVLRAHWPDVLLHDDITTFTKELLDGADVDVVCGGTPCQDLSLAGLRAGLGGERSRLFYEFVRIADELAAPWILWENVPGVLSSNEGVDFSLILRELTGFWPAVPEGGWRNAGHCVGPRRSVTWRVLDAQHFGVPQRRRRIFIVGHLGEPWGASAQILFESESCEGDPPTREETGEDDAEGTREGPPERVGPGRPKLDVERVVNTIPAHQGGPDLKHAEAGHLIVQTGLGVGGAESGDVAGTLGTPGSRRAGWTHDLDRVGAYVSVQVTQGEPEDDQAHAVQAQSGDEQLVVTEQELVGHNWEGEIARTLTAPQRGQHYDLDTENFVVGEETIALNAGQENNWQHGVTPTVTASKGNPGAVVVGAFDNGQGDPNFSEGEVSFASNTQGHQGVAFRKSRRAHTDEDYETWEDDDIANTLNLNDVGDTRTTQAIVQPVAFSVKDHGQDSGEISPTLRAMGHDQSHLNGGGQVGVVYPIDLRQATRTSGATGVGTPGTGFAEEGSPSYPVMTTAPPAASMGLWVRRLTPLECERLQGFPDGWTLLDGDGREQKDSARYKQLGNAVAVPCSEWIGRRLVEWNDRQTQSS